MAPAAAAKAAAAVPSDSAVGDALVVFTPSGRRGRFPLDTPLLQAARELGVDIDSVCGGRAICGRCQITLSEGEFAKHGITSVVENLTAVNAAETRYDEKRGLATGRRLSCQARIAGDVVIDVPADSQVHKQLVRKRADARKIEIDPVVTLHYVEVDEPDMHDPASDLRRVIRALKAQWDLDVADADLRVLHRLQVALRDGEWTVTVAVREGSQIIAVWPGFVDRAHGLAVDVGSTTVAAHLCDLSTGEVIAAAGAMNPQIRFGEDLMSRVSYLMLNPGGDAEMTQVVRETIDKLAAEVAAEADIAPEDILEITFVGNPIMHHLLLGISPLELGFAPFALATDEAVTIWASELDINIYSNARTYVLPCIAGHVGADTAGVILAEGPHLSDDLMLIVDVGTNAEIVLGNRQRQLAASSPTGPAFEGAQISCGQRAAPGAIERVRIDPVTLDPRFRVIGCEAWSDEDGFDSPVTGVCGSGIIEAIAELYLAGVITSDGVIDGAMAERSPRIVADDRTFSYVLFDGENPLHIIQNDVRAIQLAKAALYAGARLLMDRMEVDTVDRIVLTGAFGSHIDVKHAMVLGMIPDCPLNKVAAAGNAAGTGARIALLNRAARTEIETVVRGVKKIETAVEPRFQEHFINAMALPHKTDPFPNLAKAVALPTPVQAAEKAGENRGRRRRRRRT
ncbi:MAG: ASKHA domain-containing protein [Alphaproteobacteria bacterium]